MADKGADVACDVLCERIQRVVYTGGEHLDVKVAELGSEGAGIGEVGLGEHEQRVHAGVVGRDEAAVDEARARLGVGEGGHDDELEDELDANLDDISALSARMNLLSKAMGQEVNAQNKRLERVSDKTSALDTRIYAGTQRLANLR